MTRLTRLLLACLLAIVALGIGASARAATFSEARIYIEYNASANDLGFHVSLDGEDWKELRIIGPNGRTIFEVEGGGAFGTLGMTELFFEGAEPSLEDVPLNHLLARVPEGRYRFIGETVGGGRMTGSSRLIHAVPDGPAVSALVDDDTVVINWDEVTAPPAGFPNRKIVIVGYQVIVGSFQVTLPATSRELTLPEEFVRSLQPGEQPFEVLAIEAGGNQTLTEGTFEIE